MARKILLADDSVTAQNMGRKILVDAGYEVITVNNGSAALKRITESRPDLIVLDVYMPGYSGLEVCQRLKDTPQTAHIPVLLSVGKLEPFKPQEARRVRADAHIVKPFEASELLSAIAHLEEHMTPVVHESAFCAPIAARDDDEDTERGEARSKGRRSSSGKKKEAAEADDNGAAFRDFRKGKGRQSADDATAAPEEKQSPAEMTAQGGTNGAHEAAVPFIPGDITPEELAALSAVAAKLDGPKTTASAPASSMADSTSAEKETPAEVASAQPAHATEEQAPVATSAAPTSEDGVPAPAAEVSGTGAAAESHLSEPQASQSQVSEAEITVPPVEASQSDAIAADVGIPVERVDPPSEVADQAKAEPVQSTQQPEGAVSEVPAFAVVNAAEFTQEAAPIDQQDEPIFATAIAQESGAQDAAAEDSAEAPPAIHDEAGVVEGEASVSGAAKPWEIVQANGPAPSDEELAEALRLLTPATAQSDAAMTATQATGSNGEAVGAGSSGGNWVAESVGLSAEEAGISLEAEMFRTFAASAASPSGESEPAASVNEELEAIKAAVDIRLAEEAKRIEAEAPKAMAAAAAAESSPAAKSEASDEGAIANIVDRVLADLRPRIVEEIAKKLGGK